MVIMLYTVEILSPTVKLQDRQINLGKNANIQPGMFHGVTGAGLRAASAWQYHVRFLFGMWCVLRV